MQFKWNKTVKIPIILFSFGIIEKFGRLQGRLAIKMGHSFLLLMLLFADLQWNAKLFSVSRDDFISVFYELLLPGVAVVVQ